MSGLPISKALLPTKLELGSKHRKLIRGFLLDWRGMELSNTLEILDLMHSFAVENEMKERIRLLRQQVVDGLHTRCFVWLSIYKTLAIVDNKLRGTYHTIMRTARARRFPTADEDEWLSSLLDK